MNLKQYLAREGIVDLSRSEWDVIEEKIDPERYAEYKRLGEQFTRRNTPTNIRNFYNFTSPTDIETLFELLYYDRTMQFAPKILAEIPLTGHVLEWGTNSGLKSVFYATQRPSTQFRGVDLSDVAVKLATERATKNDAKNVDFKVGDMLHLQSNQRFDCVVSEYSIHETQDYYFAGFQEQSDSLFMEKFSIAADLLSKGKFVVAVTPTDMEDINTEFEYAAKKAGFTKLRGEEVPFILADKKRKGLFFVAEKE